ncbi:MAG: PadR family transcriptional regulator, regulatory protein PadR [Actinomycetota bacterium]|jgi:DNA-binding PadR family transcriptional regulator|nr:PadR family transcriptional regulator, regulatory protein PadR [Actinomycetota bacterium]
MDASTPTHDLRSLLLELLAEQDGHGYELADRLSRLGVETGLTSLYRTLRLMDRAGEVRSAWAVSSGPARRVYTATDAGLARLRESAGNHRR